MKKTLFILALMLLALPLSSCRDVTEEEKGKEFLEDVDIEFLEEDSLEFSILIPDGWKKAHSSYMGTEIRHYTAPVDDTRDDYFENLSVTTETLENEMTLDAYVDANLDSLEMFYTEFELISDKENISIDGLDAVKIVYSYSMGTFELTTSQVFILDGDKAYNLLAIAEKENFEKYEDIFNKAFESFKLS